MIWRMPRGSASISDEQDIQIFPFQGHGPDLSFDPIGVHVHVRMDVHVHVRMDVTGWQTGSGVAYPRD